VTVERPAVTEVVEAPNELYTTLGGR
jgi:hypothetical protein